MTERGAIVFLAVCFIGALLLAVALGKAVGDAVLRHGAAPAAAGAAPLPLERPLRPGETPMRDAALAAQGGAA